MVPESILVNDIYYDENVVNKFLRIKDVVNIKREFSGITDSKVIANIIHMQIKHYPEHTDLDDDQIDFSDPWYTQALNNWRFIMQDLIFNCLNRRYLNNLKSICIVEKNYLMTLKENPKRLHKIRKINILSYALDKRISSLSSSIDFIGQ